MSTLLSKDLNVNDLLRILTNKCKIPLSRALPVASTFLQNGLQSAETIASKNQQELTALCPNLTEQQTAKVISCFKTASRKRRAGKDSDLLNNSASKSRRRKARENDERESADLYSDSKYKIDMILDEASLSDVKVVVNRAPVLILFSVVSLSHQYPDFGIASCLSLASAAASVSASAKGASLGVNSSIYDIHKELREGYKTLKVLGQIEVAVLKQGERNGYWGLDLEAMAKARAKQDGSENELLWIKPDSVYSYLVRSFGKDGLRAVAGAFELLIRSWEIAEAQDSMTTNEADQNISDQNKRWVSKLWSWYVALRPEIEYGLRGWGQKGELSCSKILTRRAPEVKSDN
ncbi:hypothetical protein V1511DRAFT_464448 [Dipodascopsis uninucleata]